MSNWNWTSSKYGKEFHLQSFNNKCPRFPNPYSLLLKGRWCNTVVAMPVSKLFKNVLLASNWRWVNTGKKEKKIISSKITFLVFVVYSFENYLKITIPVLCFHLHNFPTWLELYIKQLSISVMVIINLLHTIQKKIWTMISSTLEYSGVIEALLCLLFSTAITLDLSQ